MKLTKQTSDAIKVLVLCARSEGGLLKAANLAAQIGTTKQVGLKLVNLLARQGYVETVRGPSGGIKLAPDAETASIGEIVRNLEALEVSQAETGASAHATHEQLEAFVDNAFDAFLTVLDGKTIADLAANAVTGDVRGKPSERSRRGSVGGRRMPAGDVSSIGATKANRRVRPT